MPMRHGNLDMSIKGNAAMFIKHDNMHISIIGMIPCLSHMTICIFISINGKYTMHVCHTWQSADKHKWGECHSLHYRI